MYKNLLKNTKPILALTPGEPAGVGPDIVLQTYKAQQLGGVVVVASPALLRERAKTLGMMVDIHEVSEAAGLILKPLALNVLPVALNASCQAGILAAANAHYVVKCIHLAISLAQRHLVSGVVTGPVHKGIINEAGISFTGHTELFAQFAKKPVVMMLASDKMKVALATTHLPLSKVPGCITAPHLIDVITTLNTALQDNFGIAQPKIAVAGLNPHAGENGYLGDEELRVIEPVIAHLNEKGFNLSGPFPADTLFTQKHLQQFDAFLAMYHDQGLPVLKSHAFFDAVNITLGLPFIRTSVDHGTALELAGTGKASHASLLAAINWGHQLVRNGSLFLMGR